MSNEPDTVEDDEAEGSDPAFVDSYWKRGRKAKELGGIAVEARWRDDHWLLGGWPNQKDAEWIVTNLNRTEVLAPEGAAGDRPRRPPLGRILV